VKRSIDPGRKSTYEARGKKLAAAKLQQVEQFKSEATIGWNASPITMARLCAELYAQIHQADWSLVGTESGTSGRLWNFDKAHRWNGLQAAAGSVTMRPPRSERPSPTRRTGGLPSPSTATVI
jgi:acetolactate synthase-1/2/3 large subunit